MMRIIMTQFDNPTYEIVVLVKLPVFDTLFRVLASALDAGSNCIHVQNLNGPSTRGTCLALKNYKGLKVIYI